AHPDRGRRTQPRPAAPLDPGRGWLCGRPRHRRRGRPLSRIDRELRRGDPRSRAAGGRWADGA
ncbi:MAG: Two-component transcriptional response regulator, LuxR family, partial [uncultured Sphingomonas sp.]